jgi:hypothetical protein
MFLAVVARPRFDYGKGRGFDGKIGIFPIVSEREAKRTTKNLTKGDDITVPLSVNKEVYYKLLVDEVLPTIQRVWGDTCYESYDCCGGIYCLVCLALPGGLRFNKTTRVRTCRRRRQSGTPDSPMTAGISA